MLALRGIDPKLETNTAMSPEFLMEQMEWREAVEAASQAGDMAELEALASRVSGEMERRCGEIAREFEGRAGKAAAEMLRKLKFLEKVGEEIDDSLARLES
jgi:molecular chaperone HscB